MWGPFTWGQQTLFFLGKTGNLFLVIAIRCQFSSKTGDLLSPIISGMQTFALPFVGPVWPNMLKSAAVKKTYITHLQERQTPRNWNMRYIMCKQQLLLYFVAGRFRRLWIQWRHYVLTTHLCQHLCTACASNNCSIHQQSDINPSYVTNSCQST